MGWVCGTGGGDGSDSTEREGQGAGASGLNSMMRFLMVEVFDDSCRGARGDFIPTTQAHHTWSLVGVVVRGGRQEGALIHSSTARERSIKYLQNLFFFDSLTPITQSYAAFHGHWLVL